MGGRYGKDVGIVGSGFKGLKFKVISKGQGTGYRMIKCAGLTERCAKKRETIPRSITG